MQEALPYLRQSFFSFCQARLRLQPFWYIIYAEVTEMTRSELDKYICERYACAADYPWEGSPESAVYRHRSNRKWFALIMDITQDKLGLDSREKISVVNLKCDPVLNGSLRAEPGFYPAYHMNKENWITAALDGSADDELILRLLDMSYMATKRK